QWVPEIKRNVPKAKFLLVGTKADLRDDSHVIADLARRKMKPITSKIGVKLAKKLGAAGYVECSALTQVRILFNSNYEFCVVIK
ncbi:UNVERIFIED_CONTAM: hypothetical protein GTU68_026762, partial [Idotea baltica]|nr:hypothetical protein [Idotea baltica]